MTPQKLIEIATAKGYKVNTESENFIGIMFRDNGSQWHWFKVYASFNDVMFDHTYSMNTGKTFKGVSHGLIIKSKLGFYENISQEA